MWKMASVACLFMLLSASAEASHGKAAWAACQKLPAPLLQGHVKRSVKEYAGYVVKISDGDTLSIKDAHGKVNKVRLAFIDAPEMKQAAGQDSFRHLQHLLSRDERVQVQVTDIDQYQRQVAIVWQGQTDLNAAQLANGLAWHYKTIAKRQQQKAAYRYYECLHQAAKTQRLGLWQNKHAQAPWEFRKSNRH